MLSGRNDVKVVHLVGLHDAGPVALHAAALDDRFATVSVCKSIGSWVDEVVAKPITSHLLGYVVPGALLRYDLPDPRWERYLAGGPAECVLRRLQFLRQSDQRALVQWQGVPAN